MRAIDGDVPQDRLQNLGYDDWNQEVSNNSPELDKENGELISRQAAIEAFDNLEWFHLSDGVMVHGANSKEHQAWYKEQDVYKTLEQLPSV